MRRYTEGLQPLGLLMENPKKAQEKRAFSRVARAWPLVVGPALTENTIPLRVVNKTLVMGCWTPELVPSLRKSVEAIWPELRERLRRFLGLDFHYLEIVPCDPPAPQTPPAPAPPPADPLLEVLKKYRAARNQSWTPGRK